MTRRVLTLWAVAIAVGGSACGMHQSSTPSLTGPSGLATNLTVTATPDSITQDGASQATVVVIAHDASGRPLGGLSVRADMAVGGVAADFGTLSARNLVTGSDGRATIVYTAPAAPPPSAAGQMRLVSIVVTPVGSDAQASAGASFSADIRLVPAGVLLPPAGTPTASFVVSPTPVNQNIAVTFDASASTPGTNAAALTSYSWVFGDGDTASGVKVTHAYKTTGTFAATLTVTNDRSITASATQQIAVDASSAPTAGFVFSPTPPVVNTNIVFNGDLSKAAPGHRLVKFSWIFGDGTTGTGLTVTHTYGVSGTFEVTLTVTDEAGQTATAQGTVTVGTNRPTASFTSAAAAGSPPAHQMLFDGSGSTAVTGATIASYAWDFGDLSVGSGAVTPHTYSGAGTFIVTLTVTDSLGRTGVKSAAVLVP